MTIGAGLVAGEFGLGGAAHAQDDVGIGDERRHRRHGGAGRRIIGVGEAGLQAGAGLDATSAPKPVEFLDGFRRWRRPGARPDLLRPVTAIRINTSR